MNTERPTPYVCFSHRPHTEVSVGAAIYEGRLYIASCFPKNSRLVRDHFSKTRARDILRGRIVAAIMNQAGSEKDKKAIPFTISFPADPEMDIGDFMATLRKEFKPDHTDGAEEAAKKRKKRRRQHHLTDMWVEIMGQADSARSSWRAVKAERANRAKPVPTAPTA